MAKGKIQTLMDAGRVGPQGYKGNLKSVTEVFSFDRASGNSEAITGGSAAQEADYFKSDQLFIPGSSLFVGMRVIRDFSIGLNFYMREDGGTRQATFFEDVATGSGQEDVPGVYIAPSGNRGLNIIGTEIQKKTFIEGRVKSGALGAGAAKGDLKIILFYVHV